MAICFTACENCSAQFANQLLTKCPACGSESVYQDKEYEKGKKEYENCEDEIPEINEDDYDCENIMERS